MTLIIWAEWLRFRRSRANMAILIAYCAALALCALWAAHGAWQQRQVNAHEAATRDVLIQQAQGDAASGDAAADPKRAAMQAFTLGRSMAGGAQLPAGPGLALSLSPFHMLNTRIAVSVESRHADGRRSDALSNPVLTQYGALDPAAVAALLMPLVAVGWCAGVLQEDRERGIWRVLCAQAARPWQAFHAALALRAAALWLPAALACGLAMAIDAGVAAWPGVLWWTLCLAGYAAFWVALCGVLAQLPISSAAALLAGLTVWLLLTFAVPASLEMFAAARHPLPSRLASIVELRQAQQDAEVRMPELLKAWYAGHPESAPRVASGHTWPVTFLPRFAYQDARLRPLMRRFDQQRLAQANFLERWTWLSPPMALLQVSDDLAGVSAAHHTAFLDAVDQYEQAWRDFFVPRVMSYRGLAARDYAIIPRFRLVAPFSASAVPALLGKLLLTVGVMLALLWAARRRIGQF
ncbi:DUF3526 domain-containing protein [Achromobacter sp. NPDC058515]|uniref:DUF3526 domain-containing protein n=1 Tax=Achromobacter sp. NPDC058515 TaxID=3346533 RepID=UPI003650EA09